MNLGIFGGSFSPVHRGHFEIARQLLDRGVVDQLVVIPTFLNPFKQDNLPLNNGLRLSMLEATFSRLEQCEISDFELKNESISYSYKTIQAFADKYPGDKIHLILGTDAFALFYQWSHVEQILCLSDVIVVGRQGASPDLSQSTKLVGDKMTWLELDIPEISSTEIRKQSPETLKASHWLHPEALKVWLNQSMTT